MKQKEQSSKQQEEILKAMRDKSNQSSGSGSVFGSSSSGSGADAGGTKPLRIGKVKFPKFSGEDVEGWVYRCEHFFAMDETPDETKLRCAVVHLEGDALQWHKAFMKTRNATVTEIPWDDYISSISARFSNAMFEDPLEELVSLTQRVTLSESQAVSLYLKALKPNIRGPVRMFKPRTLHEAYGLAKTQALNNENLEQKFNKGRWNAGNTRSSNNSRIAPPTNATKLPLLPTPNQPAKPVNGPRGLTNKELEQKRAKGEFFWCTKKFVSGHTCARPRGKVYMIEVDDEEDNETEEPESEWEENEHHISIHALTRIPSYSTMRVQGSMGNRQLHILIDPRPTHNFIDNRMAKKIQCPVEDISLIQVGVAYRKKLTCTQLCPEFKWSMQGHWFTSEVLLITLGDYDMVLGIQGLLPLQDILWNFQKMTKRFEFEGKRYELRGLQNNKVSLCTVEKMEGLQQKHAKGGGVQIFSLQLANEETGQAYTSRVLVDQEGQVKESPWAALLKAYEEVFQPPVGLPPSRPFDHRIALKEGTLPISQRPYRYPTIQKDVIEKTTQELLDAGIICNSQSSFAAPVVLVKKDYQWC
ncbi:uncharacterized protein LOC143636597 [Bidens hawaiensis]|uniref:uncharacterized protein LOC143636597 n=1 Tax=Bidens hawaiensis TaxID=980011 RepID=UPI00404A5B37